MQYTVIREDELYHHGILGQKWGVRRYQNEDGSLTPAGQRRYGYKIEKKEAFDKFNKKVDAIESKHGEDLTSAKKRMSKKEYNEYVKKRWDEYLNEVHKVEREYDRDKQRISKEYGMDKKKKAIATGAAIGAALSSIATIKNAIGAEIFTQALSDGMLHVNMSEVVTKGAFKAGKVAIVGALAAAGGYAIKDFIEDKKSEK